MNIYHKKTVSKKGDSMKKTAVAIICISLVTAMLTGCSKDEFMGISRFTDNMNSISADGEGISLSSYLIYNGTYYLPFDEDRESVVMALKEGESGHIDEIRVTISKADENGNEKPVTEKGKALFLEAFIKAVRAYSYFTPEEAEEIIKDMKMNYLSAFESEGEVTLKKENYYFVYYSVDIASTLMIFNTHLHSIEKTEKPESKPFFGNTTNIRTETVPLR